MAFRSIKISKSDNFLSNFKRFKSTENEVIFKSFKTKGIVILNKSNALNLSTTLKLIKTFQMCEISKSCLLIKWNDHEFCDAKKLTDDSQRGEIYQKNLLKRRFELFALIGKYKLPFVPIINEVVEAGRAGLVIHGSHRIGTENAIFAIPKTTLGVLTVCGASYFVPRLRGKLGFYLALTGRKLQGFDVFKAGILTHFVESRNLDLLEERLLNCEDIEEALDVYKEGRADEGFSLEKYLEKIDECFNAVSIEEIFGKLEMDGSKWAKDTLKELSSLSLISLRISLKVLNLGIEQSLQECLEMEFTVAMNCLREKRKAFDKSIWSYNEFSAVPEENLEKYFRTLPEGNKWNYEL